MARIQLGKLLLFDSNNQLINPIKGQHHGKVGVIGAGGRMGRMLIQAVAQNSQTQLAAAIERAGSSLVGIGHRAMVNIDSANIALVDDLAAVIDDIDVLIDFSLPESTTQNLQLCADKGINGDWHYNSQQGLI